MAVRRLAPKELQPASFAFSEANLAWAKGQIAKYPEGRQASAVIPILWRAQEQAGGWVSEAAIRVVAEMLAMAYIRVLEVATFYTQFQLQPVGKKAHVQVCGTTPCQLRGVGRPVRRLPASHPPRSVPYLRRRRFQLGRGRVPRRLRERADGADRQRHLRGPDQGKLRQGAGRICRRPAAEAGSAERPPVLGADRRHHDAEVERRVERCEAAKEPVLADAEAKKPGAAANTQERPAPKPPAGDATGKTS